MRNFFMRAVSLFLAVLMLSSVVSLASAEGEYAGKELVVATWGWTAAQVKELAKGFEEQTGCTVVIDETSGNADRLNKIAAQKNSPRTIPPTNSGV